MSNKSMVIPKASVDEILLIIGVFVIPIRIKIITKGTPNKTIPLLALTGLFIYKFLHGVMINPFTSSWLE